MNKHKYMKNGAKDDIRILGLNLYHIKSIKILIEYWFKIILSASELSSLIN